jgi:hypothetical protein
VKFTPDTLKKIQVFIGVAFLSSCLQSDKTVISTTYENCSSSGLHNLNNMNTSTMLFKLFKAAESEEMYLVVRTEV